MSTLEVLFTPADFEALKQRDLRETCCVVFDILRATTSMIVALEHGAEAIRPVAQIPEAVALRQQRPELLLAGERDGVRIRAALTGSIDFDLGNSPREFTAEKVQRQTIVMTTTNGTRALRACAGARAVFPASFLNLSATIQAVEAQEPATLLLVCSGTLEQAAYEDVLAAGAFCDRVWSRFATGTVADSAQMARRLFQIEQADLAAALSRSRNGRRLLTRPELKEDVPFCAQLDCSQITAQLGADGFVRKGA